MESSPLSYGCCVHGRGVVTVPAIELIAAAVKENRTDEMNYSKLNDRNDMGA
jgi:hypothetical protein